MGRSVLNDGFNAFTITLAHEASHYTYAKSLNGWWFEYEIEGYSVSNALKREFTGNPNAFWGGYGANPYDIHDSLQMDTDYNWLPKWADFHNTPFRFWNNNLDDIGR